MMTEDAPRSRAPRASRAAGDIVSRRTRGLNDNGLDSNLWVVEGNLDRANYAYRWVNNTAPRLTKLHKMDDWDPVSEEEAGFPTTRHGNSGIGQNAAPECQAVLMKKPRSLYELHHKERHDKLLEQEALMTGGIPLNEIGAGNAYTPKSGSVMVQDKGYGIVESAAPVKRA